MTTGSDNDEVRKMTTGSDIAPILRACGLIIEAYQLNKVDELNGMYALDLMKCTILKNKGVSFEEFQGISVEMIEWARKNWEAF